jgi:hypothetical protein
MNSVNLAYSVITRIKGLKEFTSLQTLTTVRNRVGGAAAAHFLLLLLFFFIFFFFFFFFFFKLYTFNL